ncbi:MAG: amino acid adenylation domain-containing protein [Ktedonobacteraceae bacterium]|nr:amino acid adenylation domain-containing protein [Ktedonobacteraceae bacterium]
MSLHQEVTRRRAALTPEQQELLRMRLRREVASTQPILTIQPRPEKASAPVALTQQRVWFLEQLEPGSTAYHIPMALRVRGAINLALLQRSLDEIVRRHEALRTTFESRDGQPIQCIAEQIPVPITLAEALDLSPKEKTQRVAHFIQQEAQTPFDLVTGPLLRVSVLRLAPQEHIIVIVLHHIIADFWSVSLFFEELITLYKTYGMGQPSPLPELPVQYADYAYWQRTLLPDDVLEQSFDYWREQLAGAPSAVSLLPDLPVQMPPGYRGATHFFTIAFEMKERLRMVSQREGVTSFMMLLAALQVTLARYSGEQDLIIGSSSANRVVPEVEKLIGFFANTLVFRADLTDNPTIHELLQRTRKMTLDGQKHQNVPFERALPPERDLNRNPLFQVMLVMQNSAMTTASVSDVTFEGVEVERDDAKFGLLLNAQELAQEFACYIEYNADLFSARLVAQFQEHLFRVLNAFCTQPEAHIQEIALLTPKEEKALINLGNAPRQDFPHTFCLHELVMQQARRTPTAIAIQDGERTFTYQEFDRQANRLAHQLRERGVGPDVLVGLCMERSAEQMLGLLAILKAGGAYVPLDPNLPAERLHYQIEDATLALVLTDATSDERIENMGCAHLCLPRWDVQSEAGETEGPESGVRSEHLAYVIYTSGSTGKPKGVLVNHRNVVNHCSAISKHYQISSEDRTLHFSSLSFDTAVEELFPTWISGARLVLRPIVLPSSFDQFHAWIEQYQISVLDLPTAYWHVWVQELARHPQPLPATLRLVIIGGEKAEEVRWHQWHEIVGEQVHLSNTYGPTETTVTATFYDACAEESGALPIGRPLSNVRSYVLDDRQRLVPLGVSGELYIGGEGVARGYLGRAELTAARFVSDPWNAEVDRKMYRTGDRVYQRADGALVYVGRVDEQVKIRGFRVELGEIEQALRNQPGIQEAVVLLREDLPGFPQLVAYIQPEVDMQLDILSIRQNLSTFLPDYMLPSACVTMEAFPLTISNKIDRKALPAVDPNPDMDAETFVAPESEVEEVLVDIWHGVLQKERIGTQHNFFHLGGHSLLATQLLARVYEAFEIELSLRQFFDQPTIAGMAELLLQDSETREQVETTAHLLLSIANLSEDEVEALLAEEEASDDYHL